jgi:hypothetical protein
VPTDHACHAAAEQTAHGITPVRALLVPVRHSPEPPPQDEDIPIVIRQYLDPHGVYARNREEDKAAAQERRAPEPVSPAMGGGVLVTFLDGLRADLGGGIAEWYAELRGRIPRVLSSAPSEWQVLDELKKLGEEVVTVLARIHRDDRVNQLSWRLDLVEDAFAGALRRLDIPLDTSASSAADVATAASSLFGMRRRPG